MTAYRWGKFEKEQKSFTKTAVIKEVPYRASGRCVALLESESWIEPGEYKGTIYVERPVFGRPDYDFYAQKELLTGDKHIIEINYCEKREYTDFIRYLGYGRIKEKRVSYYYSKGPKIGTVTSTNRNAYPNDGESGDYWYVYEGIANQTPSISGQDEDLGGFKAPFKRVFSVNDPDNNETLNVIVKLNSATIRTINNVTKGESYEIDIDKTKFDELELNKTNTIEITVSDSNGASAIRRYTFKKVNSNPVVTVTNSNMGEQNKPFSFNFNANDPDGDEITVKVYIDDVQIKNLGQVTKNQDIQVTINKLDYAKLQNGEHRIKIEATDSYSAKGIGYITFSKNINYCWYRLTKEVDAQPSAIVTNVLAELATGAKMTVKVSLNAKDTSPTWEVVPDELIGQKYNFKTKTKTADKWCIGVDIRIDRADTPEGKTSYFYGFVGAYM